MIAATATADLVRFRPESRSTRRLVAGTLSESLATPARIGLDSIATPPTTAVAPTPTSKPA